MGSEPPEHSGDGRGHLDERGLGDRAAGWLSSDRRRRIRRVVQWLFGLAVVAAVVFTGTNDDAKRNAIRRHIDIARERPWVAEARLNKIPIGKEFDSGMMAKVLTVASGMFITMEDLWEIYSLTLQPSSQTFVFEADTLLGEAFRQSAKWKRIQ